MTDIPKYRESESEKVRGADLLRLLPRGRSSVLDIGARDGYFSKFLTEYFDSVTALDLEKPEFGYPGVVAVAGDVTQLQFADSSFDCVFCAEVLEHIPNVEQACREIARVARHEIVIGVPYRQDTRVGRTTCQKCGRRNPPWAHINTFDERRLIQLFPQLELTARSLVGTLKSATNPVSTMLMDLAGNPWGTYEQDEPCIHCGAQLTPPPQGPILSKVCAGLAVRLNRVQSLFTQAHGIFLHVVFSKNGHPQSAASSQPPR
jgi:SAM-dependent methyltransferase